MREEALFEAALALPPEARPAYLAAACGADDRLRGQVERLLAADVGGSGILDGDPDQTLSPFRSHRPTLAADQVFAGRFRLVRKLGEGGMGEVWVADQTDPVQRAVALKVLRVGLGPDLFGRFEQERQALALMDHPSIAKVLDAGVTDDGPYFAMELIDGVPITRYCAARGLGPTDRLRLFVQVCQAVQHAHQKGVIHRDLKPDNVLVAEYDGRPVPKVIDFGVAKAAGVKLTGDTLRTGFGTIIGTLEYMAPEQATFDAQDIDTRADVYALGVLLYELLTGMTPIRRADFPKDKMLDVLQAIRETDPPRPSQRLAPAKAAAVRGDLDWIAMKCLAKNRADRYETANGLARDVERYLANEVVEARPPSAVYRVRKFVRRHTVALTAAAAVAIAVLVGGLVAVWQAVRALDAEKQALASERQAILDRDAKEAARLQALAEEQRATEEAALARAVQAFLEDDLLGQADVRNQRSEDGRDPNVTVRELLDRAADRIGDRFHNQPRTEAAIRHTIGAAYFALDDYPRARTHLDRALELQTAHAGPNHPSTLGTLTTLGRVRHLEGELGEAERLLTQALDGFREFRPADDFDVLVIERYLAAVYADRGRVDEAEAMLVRGRDLLRTKLTDRHSSTMSTTNQLGLLYLSVGRSADAAPLFDLVLGLVRERYSSDHPNVHTAMSHVAAALRDRGKLTEAAKMFAQVYGARLKLYGPDHADVYLAALNLGQVLSMGGAADRAEPLLGQAVAGLEKKFGKADDRTLTAKNSLAVLYMNQGRVEEAEPLSRAAADGWRGRYSIVHHRAILGLDSLATVCGARGRLDEAADLYDEAARGLEGLGFRHPHAQSIIIKVVLGLDRAGRTEAADGWRRKWLAVLKSRAAAESPDYAGALADLGVSLLYQRRWADAEPVLRECLAIREKVQPTDWRTSNVRSMLGGALLGQGKAEAAEPLLLDGYDGLKVRPPGNAAAWHGRLAESIDRLIAVNEALGQPAEAQKWREERAKHPAEFGPMPRRIR